MMSFCRSLNRVVGKACLNDFPYDFILPALKQNRSVEVLHAFRKVLPRPQLADLEIVLYEGTEKEVLAAIPDQMPRDIGIFGLIFAKPRSILVIDRYVKATSWRGFSFRSLMRKCHPPIRSMELGCHLVEKYNLHPLDLGWPTMEAQYDFLKKWCQQGGLTVEDYERAAKHKNHSSLLISICGS